VLGDELLYAVEKSHDISFVQRLAHPTKTA
jgi:hypothetical protein